MVISDMCSASLPCKWDGLDSSHIHIVGGHKIIYIQGSEGNDLLD